MGEKTGKKSGKQTTMISPRSGSELPTGAHPGNTGGKKGRSGRKPNAFKELCREILEDEETREALRAAAKSPNAPGYGGIIKMLASSAEGVPAQKVEVNRPLLIVTDPDELKGTGEYDGRHHQVPTQLDEKLPPMSPKHS